ncbi:hypothetical protein DSO57_1009917 [Entomophthora muscae]|uniref:Uncharacterized protein n=1 Tax=Entomophthora muscae TaxID=34485 RepID=A0ACC2SVS7_9FUNG|nr:hypothetical protein DSO57_1009917 [Entomophthora muscae]
MRFFPLLVFGAFGSLTGPVQSSLLPAEILLYASSLATFETKVESLTPKDYRYIKGQLKDPKKLSALLNNNTITFSVDQLSVPEELAAKVILAEVVSRRDFTNDAFRKLVAAMLERPTPKKAAIRFKSFIDELEEMKEYPEARLRAVRNYFAANRNMEKYIPIILDYLGEPINESIVKLMKTIFFTANHQSRRVSLKLQYLINTLQKEYNLFPMPLYHGIQEVYLTY